MALILIYPNMTDKGAMTIPEMINTIGSLNGDGNTPSIESIQEPEDDADDWF